jgi:Domain of Unknown function (DUF542)/NnrS protein
MSDADRFDPRIPVRDILASSPEASPVLASYALDTCCGGEHPLEEACRARGVPLGDVLRDLASARRAALAQTAVPPTLSIRELIRRFPATRPVLVRYGLDDCGGDEGPDEPLAWFATVHRLPLEEFLRDVRAAAATEASPPPSAPARQAASLFSPHFVIGSLILTLTLGATTGMINLLRIAAGGDVPIDHRQIHGHTQVLGFATLFLMGIAYHALPRILGVGAAGTPSRAAVRSGFWLMFVGVILRNVGQPFGFHAWGRLCSLASSVLELASAALFVRFTLALLARVKEGKYDRRDPLLRFLRAGMVYFAAAAAAVAAQGWWLAGHADTVLPAALNEAFYFTALYGFLLAWIYGFGHRVVSLFLGVGPAARGTAMGTLAAQVAGVAAYGASWIPALSDRAALALRDSGLALAGLSAVVFLAGNGFLWRRSAFPMLRTPGRPTFAIRAAFGCLGLWAVLEIAAVVLTRTTRLPAQNLWWADAARHVFTIGFLTLLIVGMSLRILPVFSGKTLWSPRMAYATYGLLLLGVAMRLLQYPAAFRPLFYEVGSYMGIPVVLGLALFVINLVRTMRGASTQTPTPAPAPRDGVLRTAAPFVSTLPVR